MAAIDVLISQPPPTSPCPTIAHIWVVGITSIGT